MKKTAILLMMITVMLIRPARAAERLQEDSWAIFVKAGFAYKEGRYDEAISQYERVLQQGVVSGALYYNLANAYFKNGRLGKAILNYERARELLPRDSDVLSNYKLALSQRKQNYPSPRKSAAQKAVRGALDYYTVNEFVILTVFFAVLAGGLFLAALFFSWPRQKIFPAVTVCLTLSVLCLAGVTAKMHARDGDGFAVSSTAAFFEPRNDATVHFAVKEGQPVKILKRDGPWLKIERPDQKTGWVAADTVENL